MNDRRNDIENMLRDAFGASLDGPRRDLWPEMKQRLDRRAVPVPWIDWALAALVPLWLAMMPELVPLLLYYV